MTGVNAYLRAEAVDAVGRAGFAVKKVEVFGANRIDRVRVYDIALEQRDRSMLAFDLEEVRQDLLRYGWVADARVSRRLPDTLVIDLVERTPVAIWQDRGRYTLIDSKGVILPGVDPASVTGLPVLAGQGANERMADLDRLLDAAPALRPQLAGASWIGNRRWDLRFKTGEVLALPEDAKRAADAYAEFARLDGVNRLLGRGIRRFDMRIAGRFVLRPGRDGDLGDLNLISASDRTTRVEQPRTDNENGG
ncbi:FtsQ-type POTRA domain-containing protein [Sphingomonas lacunae]|uniref:Cell division protein FtsQ n=2 Tax=Sphingomonas lacunae TaxID=2698828 RepID=A0A6M4AYD6_9SPHN|nr:FtsQ-type POTRA domain-containing protein [Sphingomonas lacunae]